MIFKVNDRVALNEKGLRAYQSKRGVDWELRRGYVERGNPRGGGEVLVWWNGTNGPVHVPAEYLRKHEIR